ncbi:MAG: STAS domain-containing protein [Alphaproteobacteria bacterium]
MDLKETSAGDALVAAAAGKIDLSNSDGFQAALSASLGRAGSSLILDMSGVDYVSSAGLRALMIVHKAAKAANKNFAVAALQPLVAEVFTITKFNRVFAVFDTVAAAQAGQAK